MGAGSPGISMLGKVECYVGEVWALDSWVLGFIAVSFSLSYEGISV